MWKTGIFRLEICLSFWKTLNAFITKFRCLWKDPKSSYQVREAFALFWNLIAPTLGHKSVESPRLTKIVKGIKFEEVWDELRSIKIFQRQSVTKYLRLTLVFMNNRVPWEKFNCYFFGTFLLVLAKFLFLQGRWALGYHSMKLRHFPNNF